MNFATKLRASLLKAVADATNVKLADISEGDFKRKLLKQKASKSKLRILQDSSDDDGDSDDGAGGGAGGGNSPQKRTWCNGVIRCLFSYSIFSLFF